MKNSFDEKILDEAKDWLDSKQAVVLATVIETWGSSPRAIGSRMIVNNYGDFSGSVSGGCVEKAVVRECINLIKDNYYKSLAFHYSIFLINKLIFLYTFLVIGPTCRYLIIPAEFTMNVSGIPYTPQSIAILPLLSTATSA